MEKEAKKMVYQYAVTLKTDHPDWSNRTCIEESLLKCGKSFYTRPIESLFPEFAKDPDGDISSYIKSLPTHAK